MLGEVEGIEAPRADGGAQGDGGHVVPFGHGARLGRATEANNRLCSRHGGGFMPRRPTREKKLEADLLIIGGGLAGATLAASVAPAGVSAIVIEAGDATALLDAKSDGRVSAIALGGQRLFEAIEVWDGMKAAAEPILAIRVADEGSPLHLHYDHEEVGEDPLGFMVENTAMRRALHQAASGRKGVTYLAPARIASLSRDEAGVSATLADGRRVTARLAVACDGRASETRDAAGIRTYGWSYGHTAMVCAVDHEAPHHGIAVELFRAPGPFALLPMKGRRSSLVWCERDVEVPAFLGLDDDEFSHEIQRRFGDYRGRLRVSGPRWSYPLAFRRAETMSATRLALVGDAAHGIHPVAGQGFNLGLRDVATLAELVVEAKRGGGDVGAPALLARYERWRRFDCLT
ncbi:MAG: hypothetical protein FJX47_12425, partial [Alphaproteobacteria bacterium]|nr:hypothetical protein [Alphaproteobacteria bacterium]